MFKHIAKKLTLSLFPIMILLAKFRKSTQPYLCIITPVFDPALPSLKLLIKDLKRQSVDHFIYICVSNGESPKIKKYIGLVSKKDGRFIYISTPPQKTPDWKTLLIDIGKRRNYALKKYKADRYVFIDADSQIVDKNYIAKLFLIDRLTKKDIIITQTRLPDATILPIFPVYLGRIDITCYTFSQNIAVRYRFPQDINEQYGIANDFRFFKIINSPTNTTFSPFIAVLKDSRPTYKKISRNI